MMCDDWSERGNDDDIWWGDNGGDCCVCLIGFVYGCVSNVCWGWLWLWVGLVDYVLYWWVWWWCGWCWVWCFVCVGVGNVGICVFYWWGLLRNLWIFWCDWWLIGLYDCVVWGW